MKKNTLAMIIVLVAAAGILVLVFGKVIAHPNGYVFSHSEDAIKSYFNFSYYLKYDEGIRHDGINYPYGDHLQYINSHPLYIQIIKFTDRFITPLSDNGVGILNLTMILSLLAAIPFIFLILRKFSMPPWYAVVVTLIILFLSPQMDRIGGHFEMVYAFFIPLYWYLLIRWDEGHRRGLWSILLLLTALVGGFTSAYYVAFLAVFPMAVLLVQLWNHRKNLKEYLPQGMLLLAIAVIPLVVVKGLVSVTDWVDDRPDNPWGFFIFHSNIFSIFLPQRSILREVLNGVVDLNYQWEGRAYVGFPATLLALSVPFSIVYAIVTRRKPGLKNYFLGEKMNLYLAAAVIVLLFAMCFPFKWFRFLPEMIPPLKQFRCLGRFSWIFYYIFTVYTALFIYRFYRLARKNGYHLAALVVATMLLSFWSLEAALNLKSSTTRIFNRNEVLINDDSKTEAAFREAGLSAEDFQSIMFLPYSNTCGDKLLFTRGMKAFSEAMSCSYQTGIPLIQSFSPRLSFTHAMSSIQLLSDSTIYKTRVDDMNEKPILLVATREKLNQKEQSLLDRAWVFYSDERLIYASMPVAEFNRGNDKWQRMAVTVADSLEFTGPFSSSVEPERIIYNGFEDSRAKQVFTGQGAKYEKNGNFELLNENLAQVCQSEKVDISFWLFVDSRTHNMPVPEIKMWNEEGQLLRSEKLNNREEHNVDGMWVRVATQLKPEQGVRYQLTIRGKYITVDDLLVKPTHAKVYVFRDGTPGLFDNFRIPVVPES